MSATCRSCAAPIEWAVTDNGRSMPLDVGSFADGRLVVVGRKSNALVIVSLTGAQLERLRVAEAAGDGNVVLELRRSHFQTCPQAYDWRRK